MGTSATIAGHPIHPMLVAFPIGLWIFSFISDLILLLGWGGPAWSDVALVTMIGGLVGALLAAIPGFIDYFTINDAKAARTANWHMALNLVLVALYSFNVFVRTQAPPEALFPILLSALGVVVLAFSGWVGGDLVYVHGMAVKALEAGDKESKDHRQLPREPRRLRSGEGR
jgi:uncharacterized membrane protein